MSDTLSLRAKEDGSKAWSEGNYEKALEHFSAAINYGGDKEFLKVIYSNRSAVYLKLKRAEESLQDANKALELDPNWPKGFTRKGDALYALKKFTESYNAYNTGLRLAPSDATLKEKTEIAMRALANENARSSGGSQNNRNTFGSSSSASSAASSAPATGILRQVKLAVLLLVLLYFVPFLGKINNIAYR
jgi:tetratricopeptide (TPR) repeat protein